MDSKRLLLVSRDEIRMDIELGQMGCTFKFYTAGCGPTFGLGLKKRVFDAMKNILPVCFSQGFVVYTEMPVHKKKKCLLIIKEKTLILSS